ncbi:MAG: LamG-like jellyroll fold domain-containing protein [Planctomycetota bacterium]
MALAFATIEPATAQTPNHAVALNGIDAYGSAAGVGGLYVNSTWEAWIRLPSYQPGSVGHSHILFRWGMYSHSAPLVDPSNGDVTSMAPCGPPGVPTAPGALSPGTWHHVAAVYTSQITVFVDGNPVTSGPAGSCPYAGWQTLLGASGYLSIGGFFHGEIDEARISDTPRYSGPFTPQRRFTSDASTVGLWHFDEGSGNVAYDSSPHSRHFTLNGGYTWVAGNTSQPAQFLPFGSGCTGTAGVPTLNALGSSLPQLGTTFTMRLANLPNSPVAVPLGFLGFSNTSAYGLPLPFSMGIYGMPAACQQFVDPTDGWFFTLVNQGGFADWPVVLPNNPSLDGASVFVQAIVFDWPLATPLPAVATNGGEMVLRY